MSVIVCKRGASFLSQSISYSFLINRSFSSRLPDFVTSIPPSSSISSSLSLSDNLYNSRRGQVLRIPQLVNASGFLVDTQAALLRKLEAHGMPTKQAEAITSAIKEDYSLLQRETEKHFGDIEKMHNELRAEIDRLCKDFDKIRCELKYMVDKGAAEQRLGLNVEKGWIKEELAKYGSEITELKRKLDTMSNEIPATRAEAAKLKLTKHRTDAFLMLSFMGCLTFLIYSQL